MCENMTNEITYDISINVIQLVVSFNNELITSFELHVFYANLDWLVDFACLKSSDTLMWKVFICVS